MIKGGQQQRRIRSEFTLGAGAAEYDSLLREAFYETALYRALASRDDRRCFVIGRTGSGKSAYFQRLSEDHPGHYIRLSPEDLSLPYINQLDVVQSLKSLGVHLDPLFVALWKHVLIVEIIKHRYNVDSADAKQRFLAGLMDRIKRDRSKQEALAYLEEFGGKFWQETDERVREVITRFESQVNAAAGGKLSAGVGSVSADSRETATQSKEERVELVNRLQRLVNETQLPRLNKMERVLDEDILDRPQHFIYIAVDDLDRDWADEAVTNDLIRCLFRAVHDLQRVQNLKVLVALRTNLFESLDFGRTGGQEEKFRALIHRVSWTESDLRELLNTRVVVAAEKYGLANVASIADILPRPNATRGDALQFILTRTLRRPRDAISFLNECFALAGGKEKLTWNVVHSAEISYSTNRLLALRDEWKPTFPGIDRLFQKFKGVPNTVSWDQFSVILGECALLLADADFPGTVWLTALSEPVWAGSGSDDPRHAYRHIIRLLFDVGFVGCVIEVEELVHGERRVVEDPAIFSYDEPGFADHPSNLRRVSGFTVHPAFRAALDIHIAMGRRDV